MCLGELFLFFVIFLGGGVTRVGREIAYLHGLQFPSTRRIASLYLQWYLLCCSFSFPSGVPVSLLVSLFVRRNRGFGGRSRPVQSFRGTELWPTRGGFGFDLGILFRGIHVLDGSLASDENGIASVGAAISNVVGLHLLARRRRVVSLASGILSAAGRIGMGCCISSRSGRGRRGKIDGRGRGYPIDCWYFEA